MVTLTARGDYVHFVVCNSKAYVRNNQRTKIMAKSMVRPIRRRQGGHR